MQLSDSTAFFWLLVFISSVLMPGMLCMLAVAAVVCCVIALVQSCCQLFDERSYHCILPSSHLTSVVAVFLLGSLY
jgi:type III secretory pathway component EscS